MLLEIRLIDVFDFTWVEYRSMYSTDALVPLHFLHEGCNPSRFELSAKYSVDSFSCPHLLHFFICADCQFRTDDLSLTRRLH